MFRVVGFVQLRSAELCAVIEANAKLAVEQSVNPAESCFPFLHVLNTKHLTRGRGGFLVV